MLQNGVIKCCKMMSHSDNCCVVHEPAICEDLKACSHRAKANAKAKKIKEQSEEIKKISANIKENFRFCVRFRLVWADLNLHVAIFHLAGEKSFSIFLLRDLFNTQQLYVSSQCQNFKLNPVQLTCVLSLNPFHIPVFLSFQMYLEGTIHRDYSNRKWFCDKTRTINTDVQTYHRIMPHRPSFSKVTTV